MLLIPTLFYLSMIHIAFDEPIKPLKKITKDEIEDHEYKRIIIDYD